MQMMRWAHNLRCYHLSNVLGEREDKLTLSKCHNNKLFEDRDNPRMGNKFIIYDDSDNLRNRFGIVSNNPIIEKS